MQVNAHSICIPAETHLSGQLLIHVHPLPRKGVAFDEIDAGYARTAAWAGAKAA